MDSQALAGIAAILFLAALAQAVTGFGFSLLSVPLLAIVVGPHNAVVGSSLVALLLNLVAVSHDRSSVEWKSARMVLGACLIGLPLGLLALRLLPAHILSISISLVVMTSTVAIWRGARIRPDRVAVATVGVMSGVLTTSTGINGPPLAAAFNAMNIPPRQFRATLAAIFAIIGFVGVIGFAVTGQVSALALQLSLLGIPAIAAGWYAGDKVFARIMDRTAFHTTVLCALVIASVITLANVYFS